METSLCRIFDTGSVLHITRKGNNEKKREVVTVTKAREPVTRMHERSEGICNPGGINMLVRSFSATYYCRGIRSIVKCVLDECKGTCKLLATMPPVPVANRTMQVMEEIQCDLITKKGIPRSCAHDFKYIVHTDS